jgi:hypothetical protein
MATEIEQATTALIAAIEAERARLPDSGKEAKRAEDRLLRVCKKSIDAITRARREVYGNRHARELKEAPARPPINFGKAHMDAMDAMARARDEAMKRAEEGNAQRKLTRQLIDAGYKTLATKLHPDAGGSHEAMTRLNQLRNQMKRGT